MGMVKIVQIIVLDKHLLGDGRIERHIKYLLSQNCQVFWIHFNRSESHLSQGIFSQFGERSYRINVTKGLLYIGDNPLYFNFFCFTPLVLFAAKKALKSLKINTEAPTIFHVHDPALLNLAVMLKKSLFRNAKIVYDRHEVYETACLIHGIKLPRIARLYEVRAKNYVDGVISVSEEHNKSIQTLFPWVMIDTVPNFPSVDQYDLDRVLNKITNFGADVSIKLIYIGSLSNADRDVDLLLAIAEAVLDRYPNASFCIGGRCDDLVLIDKFKRLKCDFKGRFEYLGRVSRKVTVQMTEKSHIGFFFNSSRY